MTTEKRDSQSVRYVVWICRGQASTVVGDVTSYAAARAIMRLFGSLPAFALRVTP